MSWKKILAKPHEIKIGMMAKLVKVIPWGEGSWVIGNLNKEFEITDLHELAQNRIGVKVYLVDYQDFDMDNEDNDFRNIRVDSEDGAEYVICYEELDRFEVLL